MPKCLDCGNTEWFRITYVQIDDTKIAPDGTVLEMESFDSWINETVPITCSDCDSNNLEGFESHGA